MDRIIRNYWLARMAHSTRLVAVLFALNLVHIYLSDGLIYCWRLPFIGCPIERALRYYEVKYGMTTCEMSRRASLKQLPDTYDYNDWRILAKHKYCHTSRIITGE